jgi:hypothetical protein
MSNARDKANIPALNFSSTGIDDNATSTAITILSNERVGIGTTSPSSILHVQQSAVSSAPSRTAALYLENNGNCEIQFVGNSANDCQLRFGTSSDSFSGAVEYELDNDNMKFYTNSGERMRIDSSGRVGIGTSSPDAPLHIEATNSSMLLSNSGKSQYFRIQNNESADALVFNANDTNERMRIDSSGNVGIGTSSPSQKLDVDGDIANENGIMHTLYPHTLVANITSGTNNIATVNNNRGLFLVRNRTAGHYSHIPFYGRGGGGVAWRVQWLDPDSGWTTSESFSFAENGTSANTYTVSWNSGTGLVSFTRTAGSSAYDVKVYFLDVNYT